MEAPKPSAVPNVDRPTIVACTGSGVRTVTVSPSTNPPVSAAPRFTTTSLSPAGARPSASLYGFRVGFSIQFPATVGGPLPPMASPSLPISWP